MGKGILSACLWVFLIGDTVWAGTYSGGNGFGDPYQIANLDDWQELVATSGDWDKNFVLTADLDLSGIGYTQSPIAPDADNATPDHQGPRFTGLLDGQGHAITGLTITAGGEDYVGLIGILDGINVDRGVVRNLRLEDVDIEGRDYVGAVAGLVRNWAGRIEHCAAGGTVSGNDGVGLIVGKADNSTVIEQCRAAGSASGAIRVGGLAGQSSAQMIECASGATVNGTGQFAGGIIGHHLFGSVLNCYATGPVTGIERVGGLIGENQGPVTNTFAAGLVSGASLVGGITGSGNPGDVTSSFWDVDTTLQDSSQGGTGLHTVFMEDMQTYLDAGWDFVDEPENGSDDIWAMSACTGYPELDWEPVCHDSMAAAPAIQAGETIASSTFEATGRDITRQGYRDWVDVWYYFDCPQTDRYTVTVDPQGFDSTLAVFDPDREEIVFNDDYFAGASCVILKAAAGRRYYIRIAGYDGQAGDYAVSVRQGAVAAIQGDLNYDGVVNLIDFALMAGNWLISE